MPSFWERLSFAWNAFHLRNCKIVLPFEDVGGRFLTNGPCDNYKIWHICDTEGTASVALYKLEATVNVSYCDAYFLCPSCAEKEKGTFEKGK